MTSQGRNTSNLESRLRPHDDGYLSNEPLSGASGPSTCRLDAGPANISIETDYYCGYRSMLRYECLPESPRWHQSVKDKWRGGRQYHSLNVYVTIEHSSWCEMALSISDIRIFMEHQSVLSFLSAEVLVLTKNFEELTVLDESPVFPVWPSPPRVEQLGVGRGRAQLKIRIKHVLHQHG
ncbi:uncharacterized protein CCOS01_10456 [Colletotrichum costaricense]|uniref:Uncharacterized protein n=1 Tax=Colletotrichum costaricense TaxID=1209916 RepID=A0AAJ0DXG3_9PEZI|nr:uncharacterized protein CCOS01_10456 [Colletotrichum costaricense]KAK1520337.1 hypothetical protein CCOS01_10456 [Colletotrichum costaricense]